MENDDNININTVRPMLVFISFLHCDICVKFLLFVIYSDYYSTTTISITTYATER